MNRWLALATLALGCVAFPAQAGNLVGHYVESRTCDVWTGPCFANAEINLGGKQAMMAWKVEKGNLNGANLEGLSVVAVLQASDTLGQNQTGAGRAVLIVDAKANTTQRSALVQFVKQQAGALVKNIIAVEAAPIELTLCECDGKGCAVLNAGKAKLTTRCFDHKHDKVCGNESAFYPPLAKNVNAVAVLASEHSFSGKAFNETWKETDRRGAYVGSFDVK